MMRILAIIAALAATLTITGCDVGGGEPETRASSPAPAASAAPAALTAKQITARLAELYPLPNPRDNTGSCAAQPGDTAKGCKQLITTDAVSVYEFEDGATAARWVKTMRASGDWRRVGRYALAWTARDQQYTSKEARARMVAEVRKMTGA